ncbi:MAG: hypothetical protein ABW104_20475 [Candidatus Thiodiazotropha sp. 6PLUC2]
MKADQLNKARNPLLPAAMVAIQRAAERARNEAVRTHTGVIIARAGMIERIVLNDLQSIGSSTSEEVH